MEIVYYVDIDYTKKLLDVLKTELGWRLVLVKGLLLYMYATYSTSKDVYFAMFIY